MSHSEKAVELFKSGYNCCQSVFASFCDQTNLDFETALKLSSPFGGGIAQMREVCGAVSGMVMVLGAKYGTTDAKDKIAKLEHYKLVQSFAKEFQAENGSIICKELLGLSKADNSYKKRPCIELVEQAAELLDEYIKMEESENENCCC